MHACVHMWLRRGAPTEPPLRTGPLNVVTVDVIFHKCKPVGGRRLQYPHYLKASGV